MAEAFWYVIRTPVGLEVAEHVRELNNGSVEILDYTGEYVTIYKSDIIAAYPAQRDALEAKLRGEKAQKQLRSFWLEALRAEKAAKRLLDEIVSQAVLNAD
jgi:hypothetical protein